MFSILKQRYNILQLPPHYNMSVQALIPAVLAALHNFICWHNPKDIHMYDNNDVSDPLIGCPPGETGELRTGPATARERTEANER